MTRKRHKLTSPDMQRDGTGKFPPDSSVQLNRPRQAPVCNSTTERDYRMRMAAPARPGALDAYAIPSFIMGQHVAPRKVNYGNE